MLSYAFTALTQSNFENLATEEFENLHNLFAAILEKGIGQQLKQGLYREYLDKTEDLAIMRGKLEIVGTIKNKFQRKHLLACEFDELSEDNLLNQILKTAAMFLLRDSNVDTKYRADLKKKMPFFSNVNTLEPTEIKWSAIRLHRNNQTYRMLIGICQLIIEGMLITTESGEHKLASFVDEQRMNILYQKFILEYYSKEHPELHASAKQIHWNLDDGNNRMLPRMQSDIMLAHVDKTLIIDAKFYSRATQERYDKHTIHSNNLYQIYTYVKNQDKEGSGKVSGMLLYAKTDEKIQPDGDFSMGGNKINVRTLDLNRDFSEIADALNSIATELRS